MLGTGYWILFGLGGDGLQVSAQDLFSVIFEFHEHDAVAELGVASDDTPSNDEGGAIERESGLNTCAEWQSHDQLDVAAAATEVNGFKVHGNVNAFLAELDWDLYGVARMEAALACEQNGGGRLRFGRIHGSSPGLGGADCMAPLLIIGIAIGHV